MTSPKSEPPHTPRAVVVGAGPVGCLAAQVLARHGYAVEVYEKRPHYVEHGLRYDGRTINLSLSPRGVAALTGTGTATSTATGVRGFAELARLAVPMRRRVRHEPDGRTGVGPYGSDDWQNLSVDRNDLNLHLMKGAEAAPAVRFVFDAECAEVDFAARRVTFTGPAGRPFEAGYDLLVGADGAHSAVRGRLAAQGLTRVEQRAAGAEYREITLVPPKAPAGQEHFDSGAIHVWPRDGFFMVGLPNLDGSLRCTLVLPGDGEGSGPANRDAATTTFADLATEEALGDFLRRHFPDAAAHHRPVRTGPARSPVSSIPLVTCDPVVHGDSVLLMGDAAHTLAPFLGQGVNLGLEDCAALDRLLSAHRGEPADVLARFQQERVPEHQAAAALSLANYAELNSADPAPRNAGAAPLPTLVNFLSSSYREALDVYAGARRAVTADPLPHPIGR
ncbi:FAD-dependent oxidoreductase [Streptomyces tubercidicus]|uniref:FAD-dependent oxidoreductase n=1 Tax=Streptomyces tubercidicus TaxID=47759 RepID=UPI003466B697